MELKQKLYYELSMKYHPDTKTGDEEIFKTINKLYDKANPQEFFEYYEELTGKTLGLDTGPQAESSFSSFSGEEKGWGEDIKSDENWGRYQEPQRKKGSRGYDVGVTGKTRYPGTLQGIVDSWADRIIERIDRVVWIENIAVGTVEVKIDIDWIKEINGKEYEQTAHLNGKFFDFFTYIDAVMEAVEGSIGELGYNPKIEK